MAGIQAKSTCQAFSSGMGLCWGLVKVSGGTDSEEPWFLPNQTFEQLRSKRLMLLVLTFPVLLRVGFLMAGTLGAGRRGRSGATPAVGSGLEDPWSLRSVASKASSGAPETYRCLAEVHGTRHFTA